MWLPSQRSILQYIYIYISFTQTHIDLDLDIDIIHNIFIHIIIYENRDIRI